MRAALPHRVTLVRLELLPGNPASGHLCKAEGTFTGKGWVRAALLVAWSQRTRSPPLGQCLHVSAVPSLP